MSYVIYLRKSRADRQAELMGEGETLARHERQLTELARKMKLPVTEIYREVVSGESIAARPKMQQLLTEVENGIWEGVLVMEVERLARGDTMDQGLVSQAFKFSSTKIITPVKIYDPNNEFDEEYFEFGLFMSRREYKTINRRLQAGRVATVKEGKYPGNKSPYGYERIKLKGEKGFSLQPVPEQAEVIKMIYDWFLHGCYINGSLHPAGTSIIARQLNNMGIKPISNDRWVPSTIKELLTNPVYAGKIRWNKRKTVKKSNGGEITISRPRNNDCLVSDGLHKAIISEEDYEAVQLKFAQNKAKDDRTRHFVEIKNPLSGLIVCGGCGRKMIQRPKGNKILADSIICPVHCGNVGSYTASVENQLLQSLEELMKDIMLEKPEEMTCDTTPLINTLEQLRAEFTAKEKQYNKVCDLFEKGIYDDETFLSRSSAIKTSMHEIRQAIQENQEELLSAQQTLENQKKMIPRIQHVLDSYESLPVAEKNALLKSVLHHATYTKKVRNKKGNKDHLFVLELHPFYNPFD